MNLTKEQLAEIGPFHINDIVVLYDKNQEYMLKLFNILPEDYKGLAVSWSCSDSVFRDDVFVWFIKTYYNMSVREYYDSKMGDNILKSKEIEIRLKNDFKNNEQKNESCRS